MTPAKSPKPAAPVDGKRLTGVRALIARRMTESLATSAQLSFNATANVDAALVAVRRSRENGEKAALEDLLALTLVQLLEEFPMFNGTLEDGILHNPCAVNLGFALGAGDHLMVGVVRDAQALTLEELASSRSELVAKARAGELSAGDMQGGTITLSNLGPGRTESFSPILNPPQLALLGVAGLRKGPCVDESGELAVANLLGISLTVDHRVIDGLPANQFLSRYCERLETPRCEGLIKGS